MKNFVLFSFYVILFTFYFLLWTSCESSADGPGISIYKTRGDYFNLVNIGMKGDRIFRTPTYQASVSEVYNDYIIMGKFIISDNDTVYKYRVSLINGYVLDGEADERYDVFLNLTFKQYRALEKKYSGGISHDTLKKYIIDKDPYTEYYRDMTDPQMFGNTHFVDIDTAVINQIIKEGEIEKFFNRLK